MVVVVVAGAGVGTLTASPVRGARMVVLMDGVVVISFGGVR